MIDKMLEAQSSCRFFDDTCSIEANIKLKFQGHYNVTCSLILCYSREPAKSEG